MKVLLFETSIGGHRGHYLSLIIPALIPLSSSVSVALPSGASTSPEFARGMARFSSSVRFDDWIPDVRGRLAGGAFATASLLKEALRRTGAGYAVVPRADGLLQIAGLAAMMGYRGILARGVEHEGIVMRLSAAYPHRKLRVRTKTWLSYRAMRAARFDRLHFIDPLAWRRLTRDGGRLAKIAAMLPDPVEPIEPAGSAGSRRALGIPEEGRYVGCVGLIDRRKGIDLLIRAFASAKLGATDRLLLVGKHEPEIRAMLEGPFASLVRGGRIVSIDRFVSNEELLQAVNSMDLFCTPYPRHVGSASIALRAASAGRPVLASDYGWLGYMVPTFGLGWTCKVEDAEVLRSSLERAVEAAGDWRQGEAARRLVAFNSPANFQASLTARLRERLGLPQDPRKIDWSWVLESVEDRPIPESRS